MLDDSVVPAYAHALQVRRLQAILTLCHDNGIAVLLDVHQDAVGTAVCGEGVPQWYS